MKLMLIQNRSSGVGNRQGRASELTQRLESEGHTVRALQAGPELSREVLDQALSDAQACIIAGGDGTVHYALGALSAARVPVYHFPLGTENLFARQFGMEHDPDRVVDALRRGDVSEVDLGVCDDRRFALMCSVGFDAAVVERVAANRRGGVRRSDYVRQALFELAEPRTPVLTIRIDGTTIVDGRHGLLVIANSRQYAARLDPARHASMTDGLLDVVFLPHATRLGLAKWLLAVRSGVHMHSSRVIAAQGREIEVMVDGPCPHQLDGEATSNGTMSITRRAIRLSVLPAALRVLTTVAE